MNDWQPIETAPKDGTEILVWNAELKERKWYEEGKVMLVSWGVDILHYPGAKPNWTWCVPGSHQDEQGGCETANRATHWMPVPGGPNSKT
ncbi:MAG: hypothetical protein ACWA44_02595 [Thiotrichales bacterium]